MAEALAETADEHHIARDLATHFGPHCTAQACIDGITTVWVPKDRIKAVMRYLKHDAPERFELMFDLSAIDERVRQHRDGQPASDFNGVLPPDSAFWGRRRPHQRCL